MGACYTGTCVSFRADAAESRNLSGEALELHERSLRDASASLSMTTHPALGRQWLPPRLTLAVRGVEYGASKQRRRGMTTTVDVKSFVDELVADVVEPAADALMETRYFRDLRAGTLTIRRLQGYALQHTWFNRALLKSGAIRMIKAADNPRAFKDMIAGIVAEHDHPDLCQEFGINIGLTERDFEEMVPVHEVLLHTSVIVASSLINTCPAAGRASGLTNETMVQRYSTELFNYLQEAPYNIPAENLEFFRIHGIVDVDHAAEAAEAVVRLVRDDRDVEMVRHMAETQVRLKLGKFEGIYDAYA
ncbi:MAG: hypothetical protein F4045_09070 [Chloroflexi bacterium]|nr:hypothetical protein [Chloroflexota bacterium]MYK35233.1 hypothetical protein [Chloroflexota bacterium]